MIPVLRLDLGVCPWLLSAIRAELRMLNIKLASFSHGAPSAADTASFSELLTLHSEARANLAASSSDQTSSTTVVLQQQVQYVARFTANTNIPADAAQQVLDQLKRQRRSAETQHAKLPDERNKLADTVSSKEKDKKLEGPVWRVLTQYYSTMALAFSVTFLYINPRSSHPSHMAWRGLG